MPTNNNELHQVICNTFKIDYLQEMDIIIKIQNNCMPTTDYFFTNIKPAPIVVTCPTAHHNKPTAQQATTQDPVSQQTHPLQPGKTRVYPSMLTNKQVPVLNLTETSITSQTDLQDAFQSLCKINYTLLALLPNKMQQGPVTSGEGIRNKRAIPALAIIQGVAAIGGMMIKGINALVNAKRASSFNNAIKLINENVQITHDRLITLENKTAMMAKAIIPVLKDFKQQINNTNDRLYRQYRMMMRAHDRYNRLFSVPIRLSRYTI